jgi:hypothetical protein
MSTAELSKRLEALEAEVAALKARLPPATGATGPNDAPLPWWRRIAGQFANDPVYDKAMRLGREYRESLRPKPRRRTKAKGQVTRRGDTRH